MLGLLCKWDGNREHQIDCRKLFDMTDPKSTYGKLINRFSSFNDANILFSGNDFDSTGNVFPIKNFAELISYLKTDKEIEYIFIFNHKKLQWSCISKNMINFL